MKDIFYAADCTFIIVFVEFVTAKSLANEYIQAYISKVSI
ncbi:hypothetical protein ABIE50_001659 [Chitinophaga sp. OAE865]